MSSGKWLSTFFEGTTVLENNGNYPPVDMVDISEDLNLQHYHCENLKFCMGLALFPNRLKYLKKTNINVF